MKTKLTVNLTSNLCNTSNKKMLQQRKNIFTQKKSESFLLRVNSTSEQTLSTEHWKRWAPFNTEQAMITEPFIYLHAWNDWNQYKNVDTTSHAEDKLIKY